MIVTQFFLSLLIPGESESDRVYEYRRDICHNPRYKVCDRYGQGQSQVSIFSQLACHRQRIQRNFLNKTPGVCSLNVPKFTRCQIKTGYNSRPVVEARGHYSRPGVYSTVLWFLLRLCSRPASIRGRRFLKEKYVRYLRYCGARNNFRTVCIKNCCWEYLLKFLYMYIPIYSPSISRSFDALSGLDQLKVVDVSQAQAWQRTGRAGREAAGTCYRLFTETEFNKFPVNTVPEIQRWLWISCSLLGRFSHYFHFRFSYIFNFCSIFPSPSCSKLPSSFKSGTSLDDICRLHEKLSYWDWSINSENDEIEYACMFFRCNMASVVLQLLAMGIKNVLTFDFLDKPSTEVSWSVVTVSGQLWDR